MVQLAKSIEMLVLDKYAMPVGWIANPISATFTMRWLGARDAQIILSATDPILEYLLQPGTIVVATYNNGAKIATRDNRGDSNVIVAGPVRLKQGSLLPNGTVTIQVQDHWRLLQNILAWVDPSKPLTPASLSDRGQSYDGATPPISGQDTGRTGYYNWPGAGAPYPAEDAVLDIALANLARLNTRLGWGFVLGGGSLHRGIDVRSILPQVRFLSLETYITPLLEASDLGLTMEPIQGFQGGDPANLANRGGVSLGFYPTIDWPQELTPESGAVTDGTFTMTPPSVTDVIAGGPGEDSARAFFGYQDLATSAAWLDMIEVLKDATSAPETWPAGLDDAYQVAKYYMLRPDVDPAAQTAFMQNIQGAVQDAYDQGAATVGTTIALAETEGFQFGAGGGYALGDRVTIRPHKETAFADVTFTERITQVVVTLAADGGITVSPSVGDVSADPDLALAKTVGRLAVANRRGTAGR